MIAAHVGDNRSLITSLKFQTYINFGVADYDSHIESFLKGRDSKNANSINRIEELDIQELLHYNGLDSLFGYLLAEKQIGDNPCSQ